MILFTKLSLVMFIMIGLIFLNFSVVYEYMCDLEVLVFHMLFDGFFLYVGKKLILNLSFINSSLIKVYFIRLKIV